MSHDQNFKNLILDYPRQALEFFAENEAKAIDAQARILPIRQEQLKDRLGDRFRELDIPLLIEWPDGRKEALLFVIEEETEPKRFSIHRLAHYCLDLAEFFDLTRVVPVVVFIRGGQFDRELHLGGESQTYLSFRYLFCHLAMLPYERYRNSDNIVARLNLPNMHYPVDKKLDAYAKATRGLLDLERDWNKQRKYIDFIDIYAGLDDNEVVQYERDYPAEAEMMSSFSERFIQQGVQQGMQQGLDQGTQQGEAGLLLRLMERKFGDLPESYRKKIQNADLEHLNSWSDRIFDAERVEDVLQ